MLPLSNLMPKELEGNKWRRMLEASGHPRIQNPLSIPQDDVRCSILCN